MPLDKFINSVRTEVAKRFDLKTDAEIDAFFIGAGESAKDNQEALEKRDKMLRDTIAELCEAKRLLKSAVEDFKWLAKWHDDCELCGSRYDNGDCPVDGCKDCDEVYTWRHEAEALKLIGGNGDG